MLNIIDFKDKDELYVLADCIDKSPKPIDALSYCLEQDNIHMCLSVLMIGFIMMRGLSILTVVPLKSGRLAI